MAAVISRLTPKLLKPSNTSCISSASSYFTRLHTQKHISNPNLYTSRFPQFKIRPVPISHNHFLIQNSPPKSNYLGLSYGKRKFLSTKTQNRNDILAIETRQVLDTLTENINSLKNALFFLSAGGGFLSILYDMRALFVLAWGFPYTLGFMLMRSQGPMKVFIRKVEQQSSKILTPASLEIAKNLNVFLEWVNRVTAGFAFVANVTLAIAAYNKYSKISEVKK